MTSFCIIDMLTGREILGRPPAVQTTPTLNVAFAIGDNFACHMGVLMNSILVNNVDFHFVFHVFTDSLRPADHERLCQLTEQHPIAIHIYYVNKDMVKSLPTMHHISPAIYYRLMIPDVVASCTSRVLYLDSDIACVGHLPDINSFDLQGHPAGVVMDVPHIVKRQVPKLGLSHGVYFNAGVMLIDVAAWQKAAVSQQVLTMMYERGDSLTLLEQDALNIILDGNSFLLPPTWNHIYTTDRPTIEPPPEALFLHFAGSLKPWHLSPQHPLGEYYRRYKESSPWSDIPLDTPPGYREMEIYARLSFREGSFLTGLYWYWKYLKTKFL